MKRKLAWAVKDIKTGEIFLHWIHAYKKTLEFNVRNYAMSKDSKIVRVEIREVKKK